MSAPFRHRMRVRYAECDPQGIVFNPRYLEYFDHGVTELYRAAIGSYDELARRYGVDLVVAEARARFRASLRFDEEFDLLVRIERLGTTSITTRFEVERVVDRVAVADGELRHVVVRPGGSEKAPIPDGVRAALAAFRG